MRSVVRLLLGPCVLAVILPVAVLPRRLATSAGAILGRVVYVLWRSRRSMALRNIAGAVARSSLATSRPPETIAGACFENLGRSFAEIAKIYCGFGSSVLQSVSIIGIDRYQAALAKGRGVLFITGHCGNWELLAMAAARAIGEIHVVARPLDVPLLNRLAERARQRYGNRVIYKKGALKRIISVLRNNGTVGVLIDQSVIRPEGLLIDFLGKKAYTMKMPAMISRKTGAAVLPVFIHREDSSHVIEIGKEIPSDSSAGTDMAILHDTARFSRAVEEYVRQYPEEWLWIHHRWKRVKD